MTARRSTPRRRNSISTATRTDPRSNVKADISTVTAVEAPANQCRPASQPAECGLAGDPDRSGRPDGVADGDPGPRGPTSTASRWGPGHGKLVSWQDNDRHRGPQREILEAGLPYLDGFNMRIIIEPATALRSLMAGENELVTNLGRSRSPWPSASAASSPRVDRSMAMVGMYLNYGRPPLDDVRIRQALNYAINRDDLNKAIALGLDEPSGAILPEEHWACDPATASYYTYDPGRRKSWWPMPAIPTASTFPWSAGPISFRCSARR